MAATPKPTKTELKTEANTRSFTLRMTPKLFEQLRKRAYTERREPSDMARVILHDALKRVQV